MKKRPEVLESWDEVQHDPLTIPPDDFTDLDRDEAVELIEEWFFENFEDPANSTPHESGEGGYQYVWGGPYDTRDIIENVFADTADDELIAAAIKSLERNSALWVPSIKRRRAPEKYDAPEPPSDPAALHAELLERLAALEEVIDALPLPVAGIGHNNPPEDIGPLPYAPEDRADIVAAIAALRAQPFEPTANGRPAAEAAKVLEEKGGKLRSWFARQGDNFITEYVKESGKELAKFGPRALLLLLVERLFDVSALVAKWLVAAGIGLPF